MHYWLISGILFHLLLNSKTAFEADFQNAYYDDPHPPQKKRKPIAQPKTALRPLLIYEKGVLWNENARDIFYAKLDAVNDIKRRQVRLEDRLRRIDERTHALGLCTRQAKEVPRPDTPRCPIVAPTRYCELCYMVGHGAADCRSKARMDVSHVGEVYKTKGICKKCHCIHK